MKRLLLAACAALMCLCASAQAVFDMDKSVPDCRIWAEKAFARGHVPPFSFVMDGKPSAKLLPHWKYASEQLPALRPGESLRSYRWTDPRTGLQVECRLRCLMISAPWGLCLAMSMHA